jgi:hypothetical protein
MSLTHLKGLSITPDPRGGTALEVTGTVSLTMTGDPAITGNPNITGNPIVTGNSTFTGNASVSGNFVMGSAANNNCGIKVMGTAGTGVVNTTKVLSSSRIYLSVRPNGAVSLMNRGYSAWVSTISSGSNFTVKMTRTQTMGTCIGATGKVSWMIVNK